MIHDTDLLDQLATLIRASSWNDPSLVADVRRVWGGDVHADQVQPGLVLVQLWPQSQRHTRRERSGPYGLSVSLSIGFYFQVSSQSIQEVDAALQSFDRLLVGEESGLGRELLDIVTVSKGTGDAAESLQFVRDPEVTWSVRPDRGALQRMQPDGDREQYTGLCQSQAEMTYVSYG